MLIRFRRDDRASTAIEYGLLIAVIALVIAGVVRAIGTTLATSYFQAIANSLR